MLSHAGNIEKSGSENPRVENPTAPEFPVTAVPPTVPVGGDEGGSDCGRFTAELSAYVDDALTADRRATLEAHVQHCPACTAHLASIRTVDRMIQREWRDSAPLPSSSQFQHSVASIMSALPPVPGEKPQFAHKRVHSQMRWIRFSTGLAGVITLLGLMWSSYRLGYAHGRKSIQPTPSAPQSPYRPPHHSMPPLFSTSNTPTRPTLARTLTYSQP